jgi:hypothetical protein
MKSFHVVLAGNAHEYSLTSHIGKVRRFDKRRGIWFKIGHRKTPSRKLVKTFFILESLFSRSDPQPQRA